MRTYVRMGLALIAVFLLCQCSDNPTKPNNAPVFTPIPEQTVEEGFRLEFVVEASDPDGSIPSLFVVGAPLNSSAVDSGNGKMLFIFEPDLTQAGLYLFMFVASDRQLATYLAVTVHVTPNLPAHAWPMAVGNYWVYETTKCWDTILVGTDSIHVLSSYQDDGVTHWRLSKGIGQFGSDVAFRNDSLVGSGYSIAVPSVWRSTADTLPAGVFTSTFGNRQRYTGSMQEEFLYFAKDVGPIRYRWDSGSPHYWFCYDTRLIRYHLN